MIIFLGLAGSGKSTQGQILAKKYGWQWISTGEVLRESGNFDERVKQGELADINVVNRLMSEKFDEAKEADKKIILDGYPRSYEQAQWLVNNYLEDVELVIHFEVLREEVSERMLKRGREDDTPEAIQRRIEIAEQNICSILSLLREHNVRIETVDGTGSVAEVTERVEKVINE